MSVNEEQRKEILHTLKEIAQKIKGAEHLIDSVVENLDEIWALLSRESNGK